MSVDLLAETGRCVACGLCLPVCPTYRKTQSEADSPRGRIMMIQGVMQGVIEPNARFQHHVDLCLTCLACERACPNHVDYGKIIDHARSNLPKSTSRQLVHQLLLSAAKHPMAMSVLSRFLSFFEFLGMSRRFSFIPKVPHESHFSNFYPSENPIGEVLLFTGCTGKPLDSLTLSSTIFVLNKFGFTVHIPSHQSCCGGLYYQAGLSKQAEMSKNNNHLTFNVDKSLPIISFASGCGIRLQNDFPNRVVDVMTYLLSNADWTRISLSPLQAQVAVHEPCTLKSIPSACHAQLTLLKKIPEIDLISLPGNDQCCGGAGAYILTQPQMAKSLVSDKVIACSKLNLKYLVSANIGCAMHMASHLRSAGSDVEVLHPVTLFARQLGFTEKQL